MKQIAKQGKILYCAELNRYCTATNDTEHTWIEIDKEKANEPNT